jgi:nicotinamide-nucleotide amidase
MQAAIVAIGSELTTGRVTDTNSTWIERRLLALGVPCSGVVVCPDELGVIQDAVRFECAHAGAVIVTGGLGPTDDDLTRQAIAALLGVPLELHSPSLERIEAMFRAFGRTMPEINRRQAEFPRGADVLDNDWGTAPGFAVNVGSSRVLSVPGVPREMRAMWERHVEPAIAKLAGVAPGAIAERTLLTCQIAESSLNERVGDLVPRGDPDVEVAYCVHDTIGTIELTFRVRNHGDPAAAKARVDALATAARERLGRKVCAEGAQSLAERTVALLLEKKRTLAIAESCTGGRVAAAFTAIPGVSASLLEGLVVYSNESKTRLAGVDPELIRAHGAVSVEVARALALGARAGAHADYGIGVTGIAGPGGGSPEKPVGLVHLALAAPTGAVEVATRRFPGDRARIQILATATAVDLLRLALEDDAGN